MITINEDNPRGWNNLYNSKIINGGIRLKQKRVRIDDVRWKIDTGYYNQGWIKTNVFEKKSAWVYRSEPVTKYFSLCTYCPIVTIIIIHRTYYFTLLNKYYAKVVYK